MSSDNEDNYFKTQQIAEIRSLRAEQRKKLEIQEKDRLKELHWMHCPKCGMQLSEIEFHGVNVDTCFACGGMFLDDGEVDKILAHEQPGVLQAMFNSLFKR